MLSVETWYKYIQTVFDHAFERTDFIKNNKMIQIFIIKEFSSSFQFPEFNNNELIWQKTLLWAQYFITKRINRSLYMLLEKPMLGKQIIGK